MSGSVPPGLAPLPGEWSVFFIALGGVAATLAGLSFVAVSAHPSILRGSRSRYKAQRTLVAFVVVMMGALILAMPRLPTDATTNVLLWGSAAGAAVTLTSVVRESQSRRPLEWLRVAVSLNAWEFLLAYGSAMVWALLHLAPTVPPLSPYAIGSGMVAVLGWSAMQTWRLMQHAAHAAPQMAHAAPQPAHPSAPEQPADVLPAPARHRGAEQGRDQPR